MTLTLSMQLFVGNLMLFMQLFVGNLMLLIDFLNGEGDTYSIMDRCILCT